MSIKAFQDQQIIKVCVPLTTPTGKVRIKQRDSIFEYGAPFASRANAFNCKNYVEWQIGYDIEASSENRHRTTLPDTRFTDAKGKNKAFYELSECLFYFFKWGLIKKKDLSALRGFLTEVDESNFLDSHPHCEIHRTESSSYCINGVEFSALKIKYPQLIYKFANSNIIAEITIREKQRAIGVQPMLYLCFPISELCNGHSLIGRCANVKECAYLLFDRKNSFIILEMIKIFGMLSRSHHRDIMAIIDRVLEET